MAKTKSLKYLDGGLPLFRSGLEAQNNPFFVGDVSSIVVTMVGFGRAYIWGSNQADPPDFSSPSTITNSAARLVARDCSLSGAGAYINGSSGILVTNQTKIFEVDTRLITWVGFIKDFFVVTAFDILVTTVDNK